MREMFLEAKTFNQDIGGWEVSNVTDMRWMFTEAESFNQDISSWDVAKVRNCARFSVQSSLTAGFIPSFTNCAIQDKN